MKRKLHDFEAFEIAIMMTFMLWLVLSGDLFETILMLYNIVTSIFILKSPVCGSEFVC